MQPYLLNSIPSMLYRKVLIDKEKNSKKTLKAEGLRDKTEIKILLDNMRLRIEAWNKSKIFLTDYIKAFYEDLFNWRIHVLRYLTNENLQDFDEVSEYYHAAIQEIEKKDAFLYLHLNFAIQSYQISFEKIFGNDVEHTENMIKTSVNSITDYQQYTTNISNTIPFAFCQYLMDWTHYSLQLEFCFACAFEYANDLKIVASKRKELALMVSDAAKKFGAITNKMKVGNQEIVFQHTKSLTDSQLKEQREIADAGIMEWAKNIEKDEKTR
jgi:hypothetical protein